MKKRKFGELNSSGEVNELAQNLKAEGDLKSIRDLATENGIPDDFTEMFISGDIPALCDDMTLADGRITMEAAELKMEGILNDWVSYIKAELMKDPEQMAPVILEKPLTGCIGELLAWSFKHQANVPEAVVKAAGIKAGRVTLGIPDMKTAAEIIRRYYG